MPLRDLQPGLRVRAVFPVLWGILDLARRGVDHHRFLDFLLLFREVLRL